MSWLLSALVGAFDGLIAKFFEMISLNLTEFIEFFPIVVVLYNILRGVAAGLVLGIVLFQLLKYFAGGLSGQTETPLRLILRGLLALVLIFAGNHILTFVIDLFQSPYEAMVAQLEASTVTANEGFFQSTNMSDAVRDVVRLASGGLAAQVILQLFFVLAIGINLLKLMLEVVERWLMLYVMVFTAPLGWSTTCSSATQPVFKKWVVMFLSQCLMMILSVWSVCMVLNVLTAPPNADNDNFFLRLVIGLSFCRVAQRLDQYMQTLGINVGQAGGSIMDELMFAGATMKKIGLGEAVSGGNGKAKASGVLGKVLGTAAMGTPRTFMSYAKQGGAAAFGRDIAANAAKGAGETKGNLVDKTVGGAKAAAQFVSGGEARHQAKIQSRLKSAKTNGFGTVMSGNKLSSQAASLGLKMGTDQNGNSMLKGGGSAIREGFCGQNMTAFIKGSDGYNVIKNTVAQMDAHSAFRTVNACTSREGLKTDIAHQAFEKTGIADARGLPQDFENAISSGRYTIDDTHTDFQDESGNDVPNAYCYTGSASYFSKDTGREERVTYETINQAAYTTLGKDLQSQYSKHVDANQQAWFTRLTNNVNKQTNAAPEGKK